MNTFNWILALVVLFTAGETAAKPKNILKIATLGPEGSSWVNSLRNIDREVRETTDGRVGLKIYPGGVQGDEKVVLRKIRIGQLHGGGFGGQGISQIFPDLLALEMPFLFNDYGEIDHVLNAMEEFYRQGYAQNGYTFLGWVDIGFVYILSQQPIRTVEDIRRQKVWQLTDEPITEVLFRLAGVKSVPLTIPDVLLGLQTNLVDVVYASPAAAIVLQWFTRVKYLTQLPINYTLGAFLIDERSMRKIAAEDRAALTAIARRHMATLSRQSRRENQEALAVLKTHGLKIVDASPEDVETFKKLVIATEVELAGTAFSKKSHQLIQRHLREYRQTQSP